MNKISRGPSQFKVTIGQHSLKDDNSMRTTLKEVETRTFNVKAVIRHPTYVPLVKDDIALINLDGDIEWSDSIRPVCLPNSVESSFSDRQATVAGWGWTDEHLNGK